MTVQTYNMILMLIALFTGIMVFIVLMMLIRRNASGKVVKAYLDKREEYIDGARIDIEKQTAYATAESNLNRLGIKYRFKRKPLFKNITPFDYFALRVGVVLVLALLGALLGLPYVVAGVAIGFVIVPYYFNHENENDNKEMLNDICTLFSTAALEKKNGVPDKTMIYDCYLQCEHPRLKMALRELSSDLVRTGDIITACENFQGKFTNRYIDDFSRALQQAAETGASVQLFEDMQRSIDGINEAINIREEHKQQQISFAWQTATFIGIILFVIYIVSLMFGDAMMLLA